MDKGTVRYGGMTHASAYGNGALFRVTEKKTETGTEAETGWVDITESELKALLREVARHQPWLLHEALEGRLLEKVTAVVRYVVGS